MLAKMSFTALALFSIHSHTHTLYTFTFCILCVLNSVFLVANLSRPLFLLSTTIRFFCNTKKRTKLFSPIKLIAQKHFHRFFFLRSDSLSLKMCKIVIFVCLLPSRTPSSP